MEQQRLLLVISGGIAAYKALILIRRAREAGFRVRAIMTKAATAFITPLSVGAITGDRVFVDLWDRDDEQDIGHIRLSREADMIIIAPASADLMAKMSAGLADDLASAVLLAANVPILVAPAMNPQMWANPATQRNVAQLRADGIQFVGPNDGEMAESGEAGSGRMAEPDEILAAVQGVLRAPKARRFARVGALAGRSVLITAGPTHEPIDPVRYIANRSSGKQGYAIAEAAANAGANVTLISGPTNLAPPGNAKTVAVTTADEMLAAVQAHLAVDVAIFAAAVADWKVATEAAGKIKKSPGKAPPPLKLAENPDILATVAQMSAGRPPLVIGFAAETDDVLANATAKRKRKRCDWIVANDVSAAGGVMGGDRNTVHLISEAGTTSWPHMAKSAVAERLVAEIGDWLTHQTDQA